MWWRNIFTTLFYSYLETGGCRKDFKNRVIVKAQDKNGDTLKIKASNLLARVIQHEYDHIEGIVFTDKANPQSYMSRNEYLNKFRK